MEKLNRKGQIFQNLGALAIGTAVLVVILAITFLVSSEIQDNTADMSAACAITTLSYNVTNNICCNTTNCSRAGFDGEFNTTNPGALSNAMNGTQTLTNAASTIPDWVPLIILVAIGGVILVLVSRFRR